MTTPYRGRFAPSPTGPMHFGSLIAALSSFLDARLHGGAWLVRMEDVDVPRTVPGAADDILKTLDALALHGDEAVIYQSRRSEAYRAALEQLQQDDHVYPCACSRREIADSALTGIEGQVYPGTCRDGLAPGKTARAWRVKTDMRPISFDDALQGRITQHLERDIGDFVVLRADGYFAYQLAVVVDDASQNITHVVRGADLIASTPRQFWLQRLLGYDSPQHMHLPVAVNAAGEKLSKQTLAAPIDRIKPSAALLAGLIFLRQNPPAELITYPPEDILGWAISNWDSAKLKGILQAASASN